MNVTFIIFVVVVKMTPTLKKYVDGLLRFASTVIFLFTLDISG